MATVFVSEGRLSAPPRRVVHRRTFADFRDRYLAAVSGSSLEASTPGTTCSRFKHLGRTPGDTFPVQTPGLLDLRGHADRRGLAEGFRCRPLSATTIKELAILRAA